MSRLGLIELCGYAHSKTNSAQDMIDAFRETGRKMQVAAANLQGAFKAPYP
jgi:hypothetical protein